MRECFHRLGGWLSALTKKVTAMSKQEKPAIKAPKVTKAELLSNIRKAVAMPQRATASGRIPDLTLAELEAVWANLG